MRSKNFFLHKALAGLEVLVLALKKVRKKFINHSARKTTVRKLQKAKIVSSEHIANVTGHKGINFLNVYDEAEEEELRALAVAK